MAQLLLDLHYIEELAERQIWGLSPGCRMNTELNWVAAVGWQLKRREETTSCKDLGEEI